MTAPDEQLAELHKIFRDVWLASDAVAEDETVVRRALAAVLDRHEQMVRAKVAEEIRAVWPDTGRMWDVNQAMAARTTKEQILKRVTRGGPDV